jgi:hypothetical protein
MLVVVGQAPTMLARLSTRPLNDKMLDSNSKVDKTKTVSAKSFNDLK